MVFRRLARLARDRQNNIDRKIRERSGAFPFELPYRLINMFSVKEDLVLDPFLGTGTTTLAAMAMGRNSTGFEIDPRFRECLPSRFANVVGFANQRIMTRLIDHLSFVQERTRTKGKLGYESKYYEFPVMTSQETEIVFQELSKIEAKSDDVFEVEYKQDSPGFWRNQTQFDLATLACLGGTSALW
jgi:hypothetical protein